MVRSFSYLVAIVFTLSLAAGPSGHGQHLGREKSARATVEGHLRGLYERLLLASKDKDERALRQILADNYSQVTADVRIRTKATRIRETLMPELKNEILELEYFQSHIYPNAAVAICRVRNRGTSRGEAYDVKILSTATFVKEGSVWRIAATHLTFVK